MKLLKKDLLKIVELGKEYMKNKHLAVIYNSIGFTNKIDAYQDDSDFFSNQEIGEIFDGLIQHGIDIIPFSNEMKFIEKIVQQQESNENLVVWNLSRQGSINNQKSLITSFCDFNKIPYIGSSVYSMGLSRNKLHFQKMFSASNLPSIPTLTITEFKEKKEAIYDKKFILKMSKGSASRGMSDETSNLTYTEMSNHIMQNNLNDSTNYLIQEYIEGFEIEVPLFCIQNEFSYLGISGLEIDGTSFFNSKIIPEEQFESNYTFYDFEKISQNEYSLKSCNYIYESAVKIANLLELSDYCRIDFRVDSQFNIYCFDVATTPYVTKHSSSNFLFNQFNLTHSDLLLTVIGSFSSNIGSH